MQEQSFVQHLDVLSELYLQQLWEFMKILFDKHTHPGFVVGN